LLLTSIVVAIVVIATAVLVLRFWSSTRSSTAVGTAATTVTPQAGGRLRLAGVTITVPPGAVTSRGRLTASTSGPPPTAATSAAGGTSLALAAASAPVSFELTGTELTQPVTLAFPVPPDALPPAAGPGTAIAPSGSTSPSSGNSSPTVGSDAAWLASFDPQSSQWVPVPSHLDLSTHTVTAQIPHLSWWAAWTWDWRSIDARLRQALSALGIATRASPSACSGAASVSISTGGGQDPPLLGCVTQQDPDTLAVALTGNRGYAMVVEAPGEATLGPPTYKGFEEWLRTRPDVIRALGGPYLAPTSTVSYTLPLHGDAVAFTAAPSWKTRVLDMAAPAAVAVFDTVTLGYADCILNLVARSDPAPLSDLPGAVVSCFPGLAQGNVLLKFYFDHIEPVSQFVKGELAQFDQDRDAVMHMQGQVRITRPALPVPDLYIRTGYVRGALYPHTNLPTSIGIDNDGLTGLQWTQVGATSAQATGSLNQDSCTPNCAEGTLIPYPVRVTASDRDPPLALGLAAC